MMMEVMVKAFADVVEMMMLTDHYHLMINNIVVDD
jgi:hypothetical protein